MENFNWLIGKRKRCSEESVENVDLKAKSIKVELLEEWEDTPETLAFINLCNDEIDSKGNDSNDDVKAIKRQIIGESATIDLTPEEDLIQPKPEVLEENAELVTEDFSSESGESSLEWCQELQQNITDLEQVDESITIDSPDLLSDEEEEEENAKPVGENVRDGSPPGSFQEIWENLFDVQESYELAPIDPPSTTSVDEHIQPKTEPIQPKTEPIQPKTEPIQPKTEPIQPKTEPIQPKTEPIQPKTEPIQPKTEPIHLKTECIQPKTEQIELKTEPNQLKTEPIEPKIELVEPKSEPIKLEVKVESDTEDVGVRSTLIGCFTEMRRSMFEPDWKALRDYCKYIPDHIGLIRKRLVSAQAELERLKIAYDSIVDVDKERDKTVHKLVEFIKKDVYDALEPENIINELKTHIPMTKKMLTNVKRTKEYQQMILHGQHSLIKAFKSYQIYGLALAENVRKGREFQQNMAQFMYSLNRDAVIGLI